jgi:putative ABC transport system permease protein
VSRVLSSVLYGTSSTDPFSFLLVGLLLTLVATIASYIPARWATRVDPMAALRTD